MARHLDWVHRTSAGRARTFREVAQAADSASGGFLRQVPPLPVMLGLQWTK